MVSHLVPNPAWVTKVIADSYETLQDNIKPNWMPRLTDVSKLPHGRGIAAKPREYGHGIYGAVLPTLDPKIVLKVTSDETEAEFAANLASTLVAPVCVRYYHVLETPATHKGGRVFFLWRDSADHVGELEQVEGPDAFDLLNEQHAIAQIAYRQLVSSPQRPSALAFKFLDEWRQSLALVAEQTSSERLQTLMTGLEKVWDEQHIFFGDIHTGNVGLVDDSWVITDPGHVAVVSR